MRSRQGHGNPRTFQGAEKGYPLRFVLNMAIGIPLLSTLATVVLVEYKKPIMG